jgi:hypothetical protein
VQVQGNRLDAIGKARIAAILAFYKALPDSMKPAYLVRMRNSLQVIEPATDGQVLDSLEEYASR